MLMATCCWSCVISMRLPFTSMNWILFLSLAVVRVFFFFFFSASVALLCHLLCCYWWLGMSALECAGDGTYGTGDSFIQGLGSFWGGRMREKSELKFSRSLTNFRDKTFRGRWEPVPARWLPGLQGTKGRVGDRYFLKNHFSFHFSTP